VLIVSEVAFALVLTIGAGLMIRSFARARGVNPGFDPDNLVTFRVNLPAAAYTEPERIKLAELQILQRLRQIPGVVAASAVSELPMQGDWLIIFTPEGAAPAQLPVTSNALVLPGYFEAMRVPLRAGRLFTERDTKGSPPVVIINETMARKYYGNGSPIGRQFKWGTPDSPIPLSEIIGVVADVRQANIEAEPKPELYIPYFQRPSHNMTVVAKLNSATTPSAASFRSEVAAVDKSQPVYNIRTMDQVVDEALAQPRFSVVLLGIFAGTGLLLAAVGLYGVMTTSVANRTHEIGIRIAVGARPSTIIRMILVQGAVPVLIGLGLGLFLAFALTRSLGSLLFMVPSADLSTYLIASALFVLLMFVASLIPAWRASKLSPTLAIRDQ